MKRFFSFFLAVILMVTVTACGNSSQPPAPAQPASSAAASSEASPPASSSTADPGQTDWSKVTPVKIKFAHGYAGKELAVEIVQKWMDLVTEKTQGAVTWDYYPGGSLGSITELIEQTDLGAINCTVTDTSQLENFVDEFAILFYPFLIQSYDHQVAVLNSDIMDNFTQLLEEGSNLHAIGYYVNGVRNICSKKPIHNLADAKGVIMRTPEIQVYKDVANLLGMSPTTISYSEMYTALSTGIVEAVECPNNSLYPGGYHEIAPYILKSGHMYSSCAIEFNKDFWNKLPDEIKVVLKESFDSLTEEHAAKVVAADEDYYKKYVEDGATVSEWDDPSEPAAAAKDYWKTSGEKLGPKAVEIVGQILALRK